MTIPKMRKDRLWALLTGLLWVAPGAFAAGDAATVTTNPARIIKGQPFEITIRTNDFGNEVYLYTWAEGNGSSINPTNWDGALTNSHKMSGSGGTYTLRVDDFYGFYNSDESAFTNMTKLGFIARNRNGKQTDDRFVELVKRLFSGGSGTEADPYLISTPADLNTLANGSDFWNSGLHFRLTDDITYNDNFAGIGSEQKPFEGTFDGNNHIISSLKVSGNSSEYAATGFFNVTDGAAISNLGLTNTVVSGTACTGALIGWAKSGTISRCFTAGTVTGTAICAGGLVGLNSAAEITNCYSTATVSATDARVAGGLVGKNDLNAAITNTYASGNVSGSNYVGGLVGANYGIVSNSVAMNSAISAPSGASFVARFGGNNNERNNQSGNLSHDKMSLESGEWTDFGHHADQSANLADKSTYTNLGWDFNSVWDWKTEGNRQYPVLASMPGQVDPNPLITAIGEIPAHDSDLMVFPTLFDSTIFANASNGIATLSLFSTSGALVTRADCHGATNTSLDCAGIPQGVYFLNVTCANGYRTVIKVIKN